MLQDVINTAKEKMKKSCEVYEREMMSLRAGRANPQLLDRIMVDYYGTPTPINQIGNLLSGTPAAGDCSLGSQDDSPGGESHPEERPGTESFQ